MEATIVGLAVPGAKLEILEAGCGRRWPLDLGGARFRLWGVDLDPAALEIRQNSVKDLHEGIEGDLRTVDLPAEFFDVIYNSYVIEHIAGAEQVLDRFRRWLKPGGLLIIKFPDPASVQGFFTKLTPHWFHIAYYRYVLRRPNAGRPGSGPYPTVYDAVVSREGFRGYCVANGLEIVAEFGDAYSRSGTGMVSTALQLFKKFASALSLGSLHSTHTNLVYVVRRQR